MARKTVVVTIDAEGRDKGKRFLVTEKSAFDTEMWAGKALFAIAQANDDLPDETASIGAAGLAALGLRYFSTIPWETASELLAEMLECIEVMPDPKNPNVKRGLIADDIEEVATLVTLRSEVASLHLGFSVAASLSSLGAAFKKALAATSNTETSQAA